MERLRNECRLPDCEHSPHARGLCRSHYTRGRYLATNHSRPPKSRPGDDRLLLLYRAPPIKEPHQPSPTWIDRGLAHPWADIAPSCPREHLPDRVQWWDRKTNGSIRWFCNECLNIGVTPQVFSDRRAIASGALAALESMADFG